MGTGGFLRLNPAFAYAEASFLMTFAMGRVPHAGSRQFLPRKFHGQRNLLGYSQWGCKESDMTEHIHAKSTKVYPVLVLYENDQ